MSNLPHPPWRDLDPEDDSDIDDPDSNGQPMAESNFQRESLIHAIESPRNRQRCSHKLWDEPKGPDFVLEMTSRAARSGDRGARRWIHAPLGIRDCRQLDPTGDGA